MTQVIDLTEKDFDSFVSSGVVLVDFWAPWCGPCLLQHGILERVAEKIGEKAKVARVNVDTALRLAEKFGIVSIPTLVVFKEGQEVERSVGVTDEGSLLRALEKSLSG